VADEAAATAEFVDRLRDEGLLVKLRYSQTVSGEVTGHAVACAAGRDARGNPRSANAVGELSGLGTNWLQRRGMEIPRGFEPSTGCECHG
jgi:hypothetical protein